MYQNLKKIFILFLFLSNLQFFTLFANEKSILIKNNWNYIRDNQLINFQSQENTNTKEELKNTEDEKFIFFSQKENFIRRAEILFFGSLAISSFLGWFTFSIYNFIIYGDVFGILRINQFIALYLGSSIFSFAVSVSDLVIRMQIYNKKKKIKIY
jgi:hypothetical protein